MKLDLDQEKLAWLLENTQFEFQVWCWAMVFILLFSVIVILREPKSRRQRRRDDVLHFHHFSNRDARWGWRR